MGALHAGHAALLVRARKLAGRLGSVTTSIFVNPTQFGPNEDLSRYPRPFAKDQALCRAHGVNLLFAPTPETLYPDGFSTWVNEDSVSLGLCGGTRPGHFRGVCTVVLKLLLLSQATHAVFGRKDFQQCAVIARLVRDLNLPVKLDFVDTVREPDGLALSSRNAYLAPGERSEAPHIYAALLAAQAAVARGESSAHRLRSALERRLAAIPGARVDYVAIVDGSSLQPVAKLTTSCVAAVAVWFGKTRLIDNVLLAAG